MGLIKTQPTERKDFLWNKPLRHSTGSWSESSSDQQPIKLAWTDFKLNQFMGEAAPSAHGKSTPRPLPTIFRMSQCIGLFPCDLGEPTKARLAWSSVMVLTFLALTSVTISSEIGLEVGSNSARSLIRIATTSMRLAVNLVNWLSYFRCKSNLRNITIAMRTFHCPNRRSVLEACLALLVVITSSCVCVFNNVPQCERRQHSAVTILRCLDLYFQVFANYLILRQFHGIINLATFQTRQLNLKLGKEIKNASHIVEGLLEKHSFFISFAYQANEIYSQQLLVMCAYIFVQFITVAFNVMTAEWHDWTPLIGTVVDILLALILFVLLCVTASTCENNRHEVDTFNSKLFKLSSESPRLSKNNKIRLYVEMKPTIEFTACNFFNIGFPLVSSMLAAVTTYVVIIVQFNLGSK